MVVTVRRKKRRGVAGLVLSILQLAKGSFVSVVLGGSVWYIAVDLPRCPGYPRFFRLYVLWYRAREGYLYIRYNSSSSSSRATDL